MMKRLLSLLAVFTLLPSPAQALKMSIWDRDMQTTLGAGESSGNRFNVQLIRNFSGPVIVIFSQTNDEKRNATFKNLQNRYDGVLKNGELTLMSDLPDSKSEKNDRADKQDTKPAPVGLPASNATSAAQYSSAARSVGLTLTKLLQQFKLTVTVQTTGQVNPVQENAPLNPGVASTASEKPGNGNFKALDLKGK